MMRKLKKASSEPEGLICRERVEKWK